MKSISFLLMCVCLFSCTERSYHQELNVQTRSKNNTDIAIIHRDKETKTASLSIQTEKEWKLYSGLSVESIDFTNPLLIEGGSGEFTLNVLNSARSYFLLELDGDSIILSESHLPMTGGYNFRDLGGYTTTDGRTIKWGKIIRSDQLNNLTDDDLEYLSSIPLISIVDFRSEDERNSDPDRNPSSVFENYAYSIDPGNIMVLDSIAHLTENQLDTIMMELNYSLVTTEEIITRYKDFFALLQNEENTPLLFHCTAGKDRTGMGAALVLFALGVDEETIMEDYMISNIYLVDKYAGLLSKYPNLEPLFTVKRDFLQSGIQQMKNEYGTVENYIEQVLEVDIEALREMYLN